LGYLACTEANRRSSNQEKPKRQWIDGMKHVNKSRVSTTPGNPGNILEFENPPGNPGNLLEFKWSSWKFLCNDRKFLCNG